MIRKKDVPLKIETLSGEEDDRFRIRAKGEMLSILNGIAREGSRAILYFDDGRDFILTTLLAANEQGLWLETDPIADNNQRILFSEEVVFISSRQQVKVQFVANRIERTTRDGREVFYMPLPGSLLRIQRREYFRLATPARNPLKCVIPAATGGSASRREATILDISGGGVALVCEALGVDLHPGESYANCRIVLPGVGDISTTIAVKNAFEITLRNGETSRRAGCEFVDLGGASAAMLQRYITQLESAVLV